jgi:2-phosphosulfolactate phosphatase
VLRSSNSRELLATSLCCAGATVRYIREANPASLTLVESGVFESGEGDEDRVCADLIEAELTGKAADCPKLVERVMRSKNAGKFNRWGDAIFPREDLLIASEIDRYDFAMRVSLDSGMHILRQVKC